MSNKKTELNYSGKKLSRTEMKNVSGAAAAAYQSALIIGNNWGQATGRNQTSGFIVIMFVRKNKLTKPLIKDALILGIFDSYAQQSVIH